MSEVVKTLCAARSYVGCWLNWFTDFGIEELKSLPAGRQKRWLAGLKGSAAMDFVIANRYIIGEITRKQQNKLFNLIYPIYVRRAQSNYNVKITDAPGALPWDHLEQKIQDVLFDFIYQGFSGERPMKAGMNNSRVELISYVENTSAI